jgi:hypothetical protein
MLRHGDPFLLMQAMARLALQAHRSVVVVEAECGAERDILNQAEQPLAAAAIFCCCLGSHVDWG